MGSWRAGHSLNMKIGVISDTHGYLDPRVSSLFAGVEHILHAGDVGAGSILVALGKIAPVTAVLGNNDAGMDLREVEVVELGGKRFFLQHIVPYPQIPEELWLRFDRAQADVVVFGHTHQFFARTIDEKLLFNPGYSGRPRFNLPRSVAVIEVTGSGMEHRVENL